MKNPITWFDIYVEDIDRAVAFYEAVLGIKLEDMGNPSDSTMVMKAFPSLMEQYGATGALVKMQGIPAGMNSTIVYFDCDDCELEQARVDAAGGRVERPKFSIGEYGFVSLVKDTEGNMIGLHSRQ